MAQKAAPSQGLQSLGGALVRKATETGDAQAAFFLSLVPPTVRLHQTQVLLDRGKNLPLFTVGISFWFVEVARSIARAT